MTVRASWNGTVLAESEHTILVEGNHYFPPQDVVSDALRPSVTTSHCPWKGQASYYDLVVNGDTNEDAAWYYPEPFAAAADIKDHVAFWRGVEVSGENPAEPEIEAPPRP